MLFLEKAKKDFEQRKNDLAIALALANTEKSVSDASHNISVQEYEASEANKITPKNEE